MYSYQCGRSACRARHSFRKPLQWYVRPPNGRRGSVVKLKGQSTWVCSRCRKGELHSTDKHIQKWNAAQDKCTCGLLPYPHRRGSCDHNHGHCEAHPNFNPWLSQDEVEQERETLSYYTDVINMMKGNSNENEQAPAAAP